MQMRGKQSIKEAFKLRGVMFRIVSSIGQLWTVSSTGQLWTVSSTGQLWTVSSTGQLWTRW